jgi:hypothetical protein
MVWFGGSPQHIDRQLPRGERRLVSGKVERFNGEVQILHPDWIVPLDKGEEIPAVEPVYPATAGLTSRVVRKLAQGALAAAPELPEWQDAAWLDRQRAGPAGDRRWRPCTRRPARAIWSRTPRCVSGWPMTSCSRISWRWPAAAARARSRLRR